MLKAKEGLLTLHVWSEKNMIQYFNFGLPFLINMFTFSMMNTIRMNIMTKAFKMSIQGSYKIGLMSSMDLWIKIKIDEEHVPVENIRLYILNRE